MAIAHVHTDTYTDNASAPATLNIVLPTGVASTDIVILVIGSDNSGSLVGSYTAPSGWTLIGQVLNVGNSANWVSAQAWWALGSVGNLGFTKNTPASQCGSVCACFSGVDNTTPIDVTGTANSNTGASSGTVAAMTIATANAWVLVGSADWLGGSQTITNFTKSENAAANASACLNYDTTPFGTGSTGTFTLNDSAGTSGQVLIWIPFALRPASGTFQGDEEGITYSSRMVWKHKQPGFPRLNRKWFNTESGLYLPRKDVAA